MFKLIIVFAIGVHASSDSYLLSAPKASSEIDSDRNFSPFEIRIVQNDVVRVNISLDQAHLLLKASTVDENTAVVLNETSHLNKNHFYIRAVFVGRTKLKIEFKNGSVNWKYSVAVLRKSSEVKASKALGVVSSLVIASISFVMGTQINWRAVLATLKRPIAPAVGFMCQFVIMPLTSLSIGKLILPNEFLQFGYFAVGCCPGGQGSNLWSIILNANLDLSATLTACSGIIGLGMMPFWLLVVAPRVITTETDVTIPYLSIIRTLCLSIVPNIVGALVKEYFPKVETVVKTVAKYFAAFFVIGMLTTALITSRYIFSLVTWRELLAGTCLPWVGFGLAWLAARVLRQTPRDVRTIAIETGIQNQAIAVVIVTLSMPQPDADLTLVMPFVCALATPIPLMIGGLILLIRKRCTKQKIQPTDDDANEQAEKK